MKRLVFAIVLAVLLVTSIAVPALAAPKTGTGNLHVPLYPCGPGNSNDVLIGEPAQGKVIFNTPNGDVTLNVTGVVNGLEPCTEYRVFIRDFSAYTGPYIWASGVWKELIAFSTDSDGNGSFHLSVRADELPSGGYNIQVAINPAAQELTRTVVATEMFTAVTVGG